MKVHKRADMPNPRYCFGSCLLSSQAFLIAGGAFSSYQHSDLVHSYCLTTDSWQKLPSINEAKYATTLVCLGKDLSIYAFGGSMANEQSTRIKTNKVSC
jgi:hypothetical protein